MPASREPPSASRLTSVADLVTRAVERQLDAVEKHARRLDKSPAQPADAERNARTLATLMRTLSALQTLRAAEADANPESGSVPNVDDIRREISERLARFIVEDESEVGGEPELDGG
ncbi:MAG: hypothetical protein IT539_04090 [Bradyrhizobiaceae bacterium]|nr:hypothetical protein [Bradyrhizobiaceae bacterium]